MQRDLMRYALQLEMLGRDGALSDRQATDLLQAELELANNAARFDALSGDDIAFTVLSRSIPQEGVTRYEVKLVLRERDLGLDDAAALALLRRAFQDASNASYFDRVCADEIAVTLVARVPDAELAPLRRAA
jgi:hypothetical protein